MSTAAGAPGPETIRVRLAVTEAPGSEGRVVGESEAWTIREEGRGRAFVDRASPPALAVHFEPGKTEVRVECAPEWLSKAAPRAIRFPVGYPVDQVLAMYLFGRTGLVVHAAGMLVRGRAVVLAGVSGAGKTTFARLVEGRPGWEPLSDDRVIVRLPDGGGAVAHGTPWPGEGKVAANRSGPLALLLFLAQGPTNERAGLTPAQATARLLATVSVPWYDAEHVGPSVEACDRLVRRVPAGVLTFRRDEGAAALVERWLEEAGGGGPEAGKAP